MLALAAAALLAAGTGAQASGAPSVDWTPLGPHGAPDELSGFLPDSIVQYPAETTGQPTAGEVRTAVADAANPQTMYVGAGGGMWWGGAYSDGGVYGTTNGGQTWTPLDSGLGSTSISSLWLDQSAPHVLLAATPAGVYRTASSGASWASVLSGPYRQLLELNGLLYAGGVSGLAVSRDSGQTWTTLLSGGSPVTALGGAGSTLYVGRQDGTLLATTDAPGGLATVYTPPSQGPPNWAAFGVDPADPAIVYAADSATSRLFATTNGGRSWRTIPLAANPIVTNFGVRMVTIDPSDPSIVYAGGDEVLNRSVDGGATFTPIALGVDIWGLEPFPGESGTFLGITDQGLYAVTNRAETWRSLNGNLETGLIYAAAVHGNTILARQQDFSITASFDGGSSWQLLTAAGGENGDVIFNPADPSYAYGMGTYDGLTYSTDGGRTWTNVPNVGAGLISRGDQVLAVDPSKPQTVYVATEAGIFVSRDWGLTWEQTGWPFARAKLVAVDPADSEHIFVGTDDAGAEATTGELSVSDDGGATWHRITSTGVGGYPTSLAFLPDGSIVLGTHDGLAISTDHGATFAADESGLPTLPTILGSELWPAIEALATVTSGPTTVAVAATTDGVFAEPMGASRWVDVSGSLISHVVHDVTVDSGNVYVATYGQGVLRADAGALVAAAVATPAPTVKPAPKAKAKPKHKKKTKPKAKAKKKHRG